MNGAASSSLLPRLAALAFIVVFFQIGVVSEVPVFGVNVDLCRCWSRSSGCCAARRSVPRPASRSGCSSISRSCRRSA